MANSNTSKIIVIHEYAPNRHTVIEDIEDFDGKLQEIFNAISRTYIILQREI